MSDVLPDRLQDFLFELVVVFIGVTAAFFVENVRQHYVERLDAAEIYRAHEEDLGSFATYTPVVIGRIDSLLAAFQSARRAGKTPPPPFYREPGAQGPTMAVWEATKASGGITLIDTQAFYQLSVFYNRIASVTETYGRYLRFGEAQIAPHRLGSPAHFYTPAGELRPLYQTNLQTLRRIRNQLQRLVESAETLRRTIRSQREELSVWPGLL